MALKAPFPYFGGKSKVAKEVWARFGNPASYVEPFAGSAAVLLARPDEHRWWEKVETINDADGLVANVWRAIRHDPEAVARWADWPVSEVDLHARHAWLVGKRESLTAQLMADPDWFDAQAAGWWVWGASTWYSGGWCMQGREGRRLPRTIPHLGPGRGVHRVLPEPLPEPDEHVERRAAYVLDMIAGLANRLRRVRVAAGDWRRVLSPSAVFRYGVSAIFLDPPYSQAERDAGIYAVDAHGLSAEVREWALEHGDDPEFRIALCGYEGEHEMPDTWTAVRWKAHGGYANVAVKRGRGVENAAREVVWFSPHCLSGAQAVQQSLLVDA